MKILVTVGTQDQKFTRLFEMVEKLNLENDEVIIQSGTSKYENSKFIVEPYLENYDQILKEADLIICHGGVGTIVSALKLEKKIIAVPRLEKYKEHVNDHQLEIVKEYANKNMILVANDFQELERALKASENFVVPKFESNNDKFIEKLNEIIGELC